MNKVIILARLTRDIELRYTPNGTAVAKFGVAQSEKFKGNDGQMKEKTVFVDCEAWGKRGEVIHQYFNKGDKILIDGELDYSEWQDNDGKKRNKVSIKVNGFDFVDSKQQIQQQPQPQQSSYNNQSFQQDSHNQSKSNGYQPDVSIEDDDIPF